MYIYNNFNFKTKLEARWAAFFDLAGWEWYTNPKSVDDWSPDFWVKFPCSHSECGGYHSLLVAVLPLDKVSDFGQHPCTRHAWGIQGYVDGGAAFGASPNATRWEISHGSGGGVEDVYLRVEDATALWSQAKLNISR
jgi:hypothetical protein